METKIFATPKWYWLAPLFFIGVAVWVWLEPSPLSARIVVTVLALIAGIGAGLTPHTIRIGADKQITFFCFLRTTTVHLDDVIGIEHDGRSIALRHRYGRIELPGLWGEDKFLSELKRLKPALPEGLGPIGQFANSPKMFVLIAAIILFVLAIVYLAVTVPEIAEFLK
jgi:hypothetical protein